MVARARWLVTVSLTGCAPQADTATPPTRQPAPFEERLAQDPSWRPGDSEPVPRDVSRWKASFREGDPVQPLHFDVEVRNRCRRPAIFVVAPQSEPPPLDAPTHRLEPDAAIRITMVSGERIVVRNAEGAYTLDAPASRTIVLLGRDACDRIWHET